MIDSVAIFLSHSLLLFAFWRLRSRDDLDDEALSRLDQPATGFARRMDER